MVEPLSKRSHRQWHFLPIPDRRCSTIDRGEYLFDANGLFLHHYICGKHWLTNKESLRDPKESICDRMLRNEGAKTRYKSYIPGKSEPESVFERITIDQTPGDDLA
jgi:hypothetical protein